MPLDQGSVMGYLVSRDDGWWIPDWLWERIEPMLPPPPFHPLGTHRSRVPARDAMGAILLVLRTGMQWNALTRDRHLLLELRSPAFPGVVAGRCVRGDLASRTVGGRRYRLGVAGSRWRDDQSAAGGSEDRAESHR